MTDEAPLFVMAYDFAAWLLPKTHKEQLAGRVLARRLQEGCLDLLDKLALALKGYDRLERVAQADEALLLLRVHLRLAATLGWLDEKSLLHGIEKLDEMGRQLGGWLKKLERVD